MYMNQKIKWYLIRKHHMSKTGMEVIDVIEAFTDELKGVEATIVPRKYH